MSNSRRIRSLFSLLGALVATLSVFGAVLGLLTSLAGEDRTYRLIITLLSAALGLAAGGFVSAWIRRSRSLLGPVLFGSALGLVSFGYLLGPDPLVIGFALASGGASAAGGFGYRWIRRASTGPR